MAISLHGRISSINWIKLEQAADILADLATVEMHAIQTSGESIRNVSSDQYAGAAADEIADPRPYAELIRQATSFHPEFSYMPRKFKIAVIAADEDRAAMRLHDLGFKLAKNDAGDMGFEVYVGGGMGRTPFVAPLIREFLPVDHMFSYTEAVLRVWNREARRDNIHKQRIKILVHQWGADEFRHKVEAKWQEILPSASDVSHKELERITTYFQDPAFDANASDDIDLSDLDFKIWIDQNIKLHKQAGYAIVNISLKPIGGIPGDASAEQIDLMADLAREYSFDELRVTHAQNIVFPHVKKSDLYALWQKLDDAGLAPANLDLISDIIACPGLDYCSLANARSIPLAQKIAKRFGSYDRQRDLGEIKLKISGCINACGHHHAGHIGILGVDRKGTENYQLLLGGSGAEDASLGKITGPGFDEDGIVDAIETTVTKYQELREDGERFLDTYRRVGMAPFKEALYG